MINCSCPGVCAFARTLRRQRSKLRVVGITSDARQCRQCGEGLDASIRDSDDRRPEGIEWCAEIVQAFVRGVKGDLQLTAWVGLARGYCCSVALQRRGRWEGAGCFGSGLL